MAYERPCADCPNADFSKVIVIESGDEGITLRENGMMSATFTEKVESLHGPGDLTRKQLRPISDYPKLAEAIDHCEGPKEKRFGLLGLLGVKRPACPALTPEVESNVRHNMFPELYYSSTPDNLS